MKRKIVTLLVFVLLFGAFSMPVQAQELSSNTIEQILSNKDVNPSPKIIIQLPKTIVVYYQNNYSVPQTFFYKEYTLGTWFSGTLTLKGVIENGSGWDATFSGTIIGNP